MLYNNKILFLSSRLPYPPIGGDRLKNYWLLKILAKHFKVHLVSITEEEVAGEFYKWADEIGITYKLFPKKKWQFYFNTLKSIHNSLPLQVNYYYYKDIKDYINSIYKAYDLIFATLVRTAKYVMNLNKPKILEMTDSIAINYLRSKERTNSLKWKLIYSFEGNRLLNFERICVKNFNITLLVNKEETDFFNNNKVVWLPNGVNEELLSYDKQDIRYKNCIAFFGKMNYQPNIDAVFWFVNNILPYINKNLKFIVVGAYPTNEIMKLKEKYQNIEITGFVKDPYEILKSSLCVPAPMQTGAGIQNKILETMALGTINIISSLAAKPIGAKNREHFLVVDNPKEMADLINDIYNNTPQYEYLKENAREYIKNNFTWTIYENQILEIIEEVLS